MYQIVCDCILFKVPELTKTDMYSILYRINNESFRSYDMFHYLQNRDINFNIKYRYIKEISFLKNIFLFRKIYLPLFFIIKK